MLQVLRDLFRLVPTPAVEPGRDGYVVDRVFVIPGHLFVTTTPKQTTPPDDASQHATTSDDSKQNKGYFTGSACLFVRLTVNKIVLQARHSYMLSVVSL